jgi:uncharacterized membrane protein
VNTHATAGKKWTEVELNSLAVENQVRLRGLEVTRLDTFIDAAFAFVLTLLIISFDEIPSDYDELLTAIKRTPAFFVTFGLLMMFWYQHRRWSRCYGLENTRTVLLSLALIFVVFVYVYPLRIIFELFFSEITGGYLPSNFQIQNAGELRRIFIFYSIGFFAMSLTLCLLYQAALHSSTPLALNRIEQRVTKLGILSWAVVASFGLLSILLALILPDNWVELAVYVYFGLPIAVPLLSLLDRGGNLTQDSSG